MEKSLGSLSNTRPTCKIGAAFFGLQCMSESGNRDRVYCRRVCVCVCVCVCVSNFPRLFRYHSQTSKLSSLFSLPSAKVITHTQTLSLPLFLAHTHRHTHTLSHTHTHTHTHTRKRCEIAVPHRFNRGGNLAINFLTFLTSVFQSAHRLSLSLSLSHIRTQTNICCWLVSLPRCRLLEAT